MKTLTGHSAEITNGNLVLSAHPISPVTISVPHDGLNGLSLLGLFKSRDKGYKGRDKYVWDIVRDIIVEYPLNVVYGLMPRAYVDYNRAWPTGINYYPLTQKEVHTALEDAELQSSYNDYHSAIGSQITSGIQLYGKRRCVLFDFHGFSKQPPYSPPDGYDLILGTGNRISVPHGEPDIRFASFLRELGYKVFIPGPLSQGNVEDWYSADFTTRHHSEQLNVNVIQVEINIRFRTKETRHLGQKLSHHIAQFLIKEYSV